MGGPNKNGPMGCPCCAGPRPWDAALRGRGGLRDRLFARLMRGGAAKYNQLLGERKRALFSEIGWGADGLRITGVDPNPAMAPYARESLAAAGLASGNVALLQGVAESLPVADESQDAVICTLVLCSVVSQERALSEARRVLRRGGKLLFMEHVAAPYGSLTRRLQDLWNPAQLWLAECNCNRQTWEALETAGFASLRVERVQATSNPLCALIAPHIAGVAVK
ncbi:Methyltransferase-like protein 7A [Monoraphidium neglectum]|uniref:Methyltransferase-like protein 7A n=1 Tax=Monoraphidium neglectum TaxID=145388 RepID=A0A0D2JY94_9CHLO|nr:Methyltransferase-like protein 7A [Monoraphidium neglectum]KIZ03558.1 Methyltransferase-like protein 7A [Monoraphidium neglectum]|eukprot:XP_013902577.1 Methyltransferase-like protein 7A [Monoraphidium neglectum]